MLYASEACTNVLRGVPKDVELNDGEDVHDHDDEHDSHQQLSTVIGNGTNNSSQRLHTVNLQEAVGGHTEASALEDHPHVRTKHTQEALTKSRR